MPLMYDGRTVRTYTVERTLSEGENARAMAARDTTGRPVFLKLYTDPIPSDSWFSDFVAHQDRLRKALESVSSSEGGSTLSVVEGAHEYFEHDDHYWQAKEWVEGKSLADVLDASADAPTSFTDEQRMTNALVLLYALEKVHDQNIVHCDLKPDNVFMMDTAGAAVGLRVKLVDFDFSFFEGSKPPWVAAGYRYLFTEGWESPEHLRGEVPTRASDVFTTGLILYKLLCGLHPFDDMEQALRRAGRPPIEAYSSLPKPVSDVIWAMLDPTAKNRPRAEEAHGAFLKATVGGGAPFSPRVPPPHAGPGAAGGGVSTRVRLSGSSGTWPLHKTTVFTRQMGKVFGDDYKYLSPEQFRIVKNDTNDRWEIETLAGTTNSTHLGDQKLIPGNSVELHAGDTIRVGTLCISVDFESP